MIKTTYNGVTHRLKTPIVENGKSFPFGYVSDMPDILKTSFRVVISSEPDALTNESLAEMIDESERKKLFADLEKIEGRSLSWMVIYLDAEEATRSSGGGNGSAGGGRRAQFEKGPDLEQTKAKEPEKTRERAPSPEKGMKPLAPEPEPPSRSGPEPGMF
jgi:hypothetical protein